MFAEGHDPDTCVQLSPRIYLSPLPLAEAVSER